MDQRLFALKKQALQIRNNEGNLYGQRMKYKDKKELQGTLTCIWIVHT